MGFLYNPHVIRRIVVYGPSTLLLVILLTVARSFGQNGPRHASLLTFDGLQHALMGDRKSLDHDSNLALQHAMNGNPDQGNAVHDQPVVQASIRDIPAHDDAGGRTMWRAS